MEPGQITKQLETHLPTSGMITETATWSKELMSWEQSYGELQ
jgi:hypothetical protein